MLGTSKSGGRGNTGRGRSEIKFRLIKYLLQKHNEKILLKNGFIHCAYCKKIIFESDKYCRYCGKPTEIGRRMRKTEGYYSKNAYGATDGNSKGTLKIEVTNMPEFRELLQKAEEEARQLKETLGKLRCFNLAVDFSVADSVSEQ